MSRPISVQLYSLREECQQDFPAVIKRLGEIGYVGVEPFSLLDYEASEVKSMLDDAGLVTSSAHVNLIREADVEAALDAQAELGNMNIIVPMVPPNVFENHDTIQAVADEMNAANEKVRVYGMTLGYHNHWWEFQNKIDGRTAYDHFFDLMAPEIFSELDVYWAQTGGADPITVIRNLADRCRFLHVKDGPCDDPASDHVAVGDGIVDIAGILGSADAAEWHVVELDRCGTDMFTAVQGSHAFLVGEGLSEGKGA